jgi:hypothetical protein
MTSVNVPERMNELSAGVTRLFHATTERRRGPYRRSLFGCHKLNTRGRKSMKNRYAMALAMLIGIGLGAVGVQSLHAQAKPPVYMIAINDVTNPDGYKNEYLPPAQASIKAMVVCTPLQESER